MSVILVALVLTFFRAFSFFCASASLALCLAFSFFTHSLLILYDPFSFLNRSALIPALMAVVMLDRNFFSSSSLRWACSCSMNFIMAGTDDPVRSLSSRMASWTMSTYLGLPDLLAAADTLA